MTDDSGIATAVIIAVLRLTRAILADHTQLGVQFCADLLSCLDCEKFKRLY